MKKLFTCLGVVFAAIILLVIVVFAIFLTRAFKLGNEATAYINSEVPKIVAHWNPQELIDRASPELMYSVKSPEDLKQLFVMLRQLGSLKHLDTPQGGVRTGIAIDTGSTTVGNFTIPAEFEKGPATISIQLIKTGDDWKISGFGIHSKVFLLPAENKQPNP